MKQRNTKIIVWVVGVIIVLLGLFAIVPVLFAVFMGPGVKTEPLDATNAEPATTSVDGRWEVVQGSPPNSSAVGFTFNELLPSDARTTSGTTHEVSGSATVEGGTLTATEITVDMTAIKTDKQVRDSNVREKLFHTSQYPSATFTLTRPVDISAVPEDGTVGRVRVVGDLTITGHTNEIDAEFDVLRDADRLIVSGSPTINRNDYGVTSPEMIAAKIADEGELNIRLAFAKAE